VNHVITNFFAKFLSCFVHTLQLVVTSFSKYWSFQKLVKHVNALVQKVNKSSKATEKLVQLCSRKLVGIGARPNQMEHGSLHV